MWPGLVIPMIFTPLILRLIPTHFLPVLVADYLAVHFLVYGAITMVWLLLSAARAKMATKRGLSPGLVSSPLLTATSAYTFIAIIWPLDSYVTSFIPVGTRPVIIAVLMVGTLFYFLSDEWLTRGKGAARGAYIVSKLALLVSLAVAVALDPHRLFFLAIISPVILLFLVVYGVLSRWIYNRTGDPFAGGVASALAFAWAIGVTFPLLTN